MKEFGLVLRNATILVGNRVEERNIGISKGVIEEISSARLVSLYSIDCKGKFLIPGLIDCHVHFRVPGMEQKEDWVSGSEAALSGGITTVIDMPNTNPALTTIELLNQKKAIAEQDSKCNFAFHFGAANSNIAELEKLEKAMGIVSIKVFMGSSTGDLLVTDESILRNIFAVAKKKDLPVCVHAEDEETIRKNAAEARAKGWNSAEQHAQIRSSEAEAIAIEKALRLQGEIGNRLHVCHVSTKAGIELVTQAKQHSALVSCEVTPHHLFMTEYDAKVLGNFAKVNPPLRSEEDRAALWNAINHGVVDCIATDHAPHTVEEKQQDYWNAPAGLPGVETMLPLLLNAAAGEKISLQQIQKLCCENPAKIFGLPNCGTIRKGNRADLVLLDLNGETTIKNDSIKSKCGWSPFNGWTLKGKIENVFLAGKKVA